MYLFGLDFQSAYLLQGIRETTLAGYRDRLDYYCRAGGILPCGKSA